MEKFNIYVCSACGSRSEETANQFKPDEWFFGRVDNFHTTFPFVGGITGEQGYYCSVNCAKNFLGSYFDAVKANVNDQCDNYLNTVNCN